MAVLSLDTPSFSSQLNGSISMESSSPLLSPSPSVLSEKEDYWSTLRNRVDTLLENRQSINQNSEFPVSSSRKEEDDCLLLLRGFDSISSSLIQLKGNLHKALEGARDLSKPSLTEILQNDAEKSEEGSKNLKKRRHDDESEEQSIENQKGGDELKNGKLKKAKNLAISMAANAASLARQVKLIRSDLSFMQERCDMLEEENMRLRNGSDKPEEDDLVRLQLEALLAEKSRLATENANLIRENQCLHQLVEYHQLTCSSEDIDQTYEQVVGGMCLDFSSPSSDSDDSNSSEIDAPSTPRSDIVGFSACLDQCYEEHK
ncbi:hypothetical protein C5167_004209 [Papaver somniferum]|uniref:uncharacterized protein LOC113332359 n=1 Tax=Papaver somniferum TaxID=3469 RepID=UPI000E706081|nr:uncharacterized protein LOC113332359 [Papaver somniferum]RZC88032.1 hypothetical protein C5167_004209 [Papaver somniferum]